MTEDLIVTEDLIAEFLADSERAGVSMTPFRLFVSKIPHRKIVRLGQILGLFLYYLDPRHRRIVRRNLKFAFPEWDWNRVLRITKKVYKNFGVTALEILPPLSGGRV